jgi:hypothetical protein
MQHLVSFTQFAYGEVPSVVLMVMPLPPRMLECRPLAVLLSPPLTLDWSLLAVLL